MAIAQAQAKSASENERRTPLRLVTQGAANHAAVSTQPGQGESLAGRLKMLRDAGIGLVEQFRAARDHEDAAKIRQIALDTCVAMLESDDRREFNRGVQFCLALVREQTRIVEIESKLAIAGMDMAMQAIWPTVTQFKSEVAVATSRTKPGSAHRT